MPNYYPDVSDPAYMDKLPRLKRRLPRKAIETMRRVMTVDDFACSVVRVVAFAPNAQDRWPADFAVVIEDAQGIVWENYAFSACGLPWDRGIPGRSITSGWFSVTTAVSGWMPTMPRVPESAACTQSSTGREGWRGSIDGAG